MSSSGRGVIEKEKNTVGAGGEENGEKRIANHEKFIVFYMKMRLQSIARRGRHNTHFQCALWLLVTAMWAILKIIIIFGVDVNYSPFDVRISGRRQGQRRQADVRPPVNVFFRCKSVGSEP